MRPHTFRLAESEANQLQAAYLHCRHADIKNRYQAVCLFGTGYALTHIQDICTCSRTSLMEWVHT